jgi:flavodoxin
MKTLVIYDSRFGNTKKIAETVLEVTGGEILCVTDFNPTNLAEADLIVVGSPIHGWHPSEDTTVFLEHLERSMLKGKYVAAFDTGYRSRLSGNAAARIIKALEKAGGTALVPTHKSIIEHAEGPLGPNEVAHARQWAQKLVVRYRTVARPPTMTTP